MTDDIDDAIETAVRHAREAAGEMSETPVNSHAHHRPVADVRRREAALGPGKSLAGAPG